MSSEPGITLWVAFGAGLVSFLSPCVLPLIPSYVAFVTGFSLKELQSGDKSGEMIKRMVLNSLFFIAGFSAVFIALGASASFIGRVLSEYKDLISRIGGLIIIFLGVFLTGVIKVGFLSHEKKFRVVRKPFGILGAFVVGLAFAAGWTPCVGPILGSVLVIAGSSSQMMRGVVLLSMYSLGLGIPFFIATVAIGWFLSVNKKLMRFVHPLTVFAGIVLVIIGLLMASGKFTRLIYWLSF